ncbi:MAG: aldose 1-epimerase family protein [Clostridia bacterium]|nr:aldose 1-epimerase family protein [Clostridia bacterium]
MNLFANTYTKRELLECIGDLSAVADARASTLLDGSGRGMRIVDVRAGSGFSFTVLPDRGLDIAHCEYQGVPLAFVSKTGLVSPYLYEHGGTGFLRSFTGGLLTTCGYTHMGAAGMDEGETLGLHGRATALLADDLCVRKEWQGDDYLLEVSGTLRQSAFFAEHITLGRKITVKAGEQKLLIEDTYENNGFNTQPFMLLYHINFGYPIVSPDSVLITSGADVIPRDDDAASGLDQHARFEPPTHNYREQVFYHHMHKTQDGKAWACILNKKMDLGAYVRYDTTELPYLIQWKQMGQGDYVCGLEPGNTYPEGRAAARERGQLRYIEPGETKRLWLEIGVAGGCIQRPFANECE